MTPDPLDEHIEATQRRLAVLRQRARASPDPLGVLEQALEDLAATLEELHVSAEELREQNEQLAAARGIIEAERQRYEDLFDFAPDAYLVTDAHGVIHEANDAAATLLHRRRDYLVHKPLAVFIAPSEHQAFHEQLNRLQSGAIDRLYEWETHLQGHDRPAVLVAMTAASVCASDGRLTGLRWLLRDITARKRFEAQLQQAQRLEAIGRLVGGVAHDFNNQLTVINGSLQLLLTRLPSNDPGRRNAERIRASAEHSGRLVQQLLTFSRPQPVELCLLNLSELVNGMAPMLRLLLGEAIALQAQTATGVWPIRASRDRIEQLIMNLIGNARDAMVSPGGTIVGDTVAVRTANVPADTFAGLAFAGVPAGDYVSLTVSDNGSGMPPEVQNASLNRSSPPKK